MSVKKDGFIEFVQLQAQKLNKIFMLDSGEGRDFYDPKTGWDVEDLSGWLITKGQKEQFLKDCNNDKIYDDFTKEYVFVKWLKNDNDEIEIVFINTKTE